jgi:uncharacterized protein (TIGR03086 family)
MEATSPAPSPSADRRDALVRAFELAAAVTARVHPDQLGGPTPCPAFDVAALVDHLVGAAWRSVDIARGVTPTGEEFPHVLLADAPGELRRAGADAASAWTDDRLEATTTMPWGETYQGTTLVDMYLSELVAHAWDLAVATGQDLPIDDDLAAEALAAARSMLCPEYRDMLGVGSPFGAEQPVADDAAALERFVAFTGRRPGWRP